ncbi:hypothetical protein BD324DRAFT_618668 [Kockovaella imperatae]|uniref:Uncharacterized protein n=1 Tax=Kockovaella imperatae TaxID=4999 RepID=A0A1Y1UNS4_9TREE|nr:hypothetical protein BD324DRAFT_618668 [Kockovaella imperatae]ORX39154.1 hypothetical protein BD324DRAFT_618668 [Kockovaella imperatae]
MATSNSGMSLPALDPPTSFAFYPYGLSSQRQTHSSIRGLSLPSTTPDSLTGAGPGPKTEEIVREKLARARAERRALMGRRPPGVALGREAEELSDEEAAMEDEKQNINLFGHRFLLPFGRRLTQMEMEAAPVSAVSRNFKPRAHMPSVAFTL